MNIHELRDLLRDIGLHKQKPVGGSNGKVNTMVCCPWHGESRPSCGVVLDNRDVYGQCYSCKESFTLPKLVSQCMDFSIADAVSFLQERYNVFFKEFETSDKARRRYDDAIEENSHKERFTLPYAKLAPFRSGKETHGYFFERGFDKQDAKDAMIGWDRVRKRITIPVFHADGVLCGFSGRAVLEMKLPDGSMNPAYENAYGELPKYYIYENFPVAEVLYGSHNFSSTKKKAKIVEGMFDQIWMRKKGQTESVSIIVAKMAMDKKNGTSTQAQILHKLGVEEVEFMHDDDDAGRVGKQVAYEILGNDFRCYDTQYPEGFKDSVGMTQLQLELMSENRWFYGKKQGGLKRYE